MGKVIQEFKEFAVKGNVIDLAVGVIIGGAFGKIVSSLVADIIMPPLGLVIGGLNFKDLSLVLKRGIDGKADVTLSYGIFIQNVVDFLIVAAAVFAFVKIITVVRKKMEKEKAVLVPPTPPAEIKLLTEIRDALKELKK